MTRYRKALNLNLIAMALALTLVSSLVPGRVTSRNPGDMGCAPSCEVVAGGWPFPYLVDSLHFSPGGSVSLSDALLWSGDEIWYDALAASFVCWLGVAAALAWWSARGRARSAARERG